MFLPWLHADTSCCFVCVHILKLKFDSPCLCLLASCAGDAGQFAFTLKNDGNVGLRLLQVLQGSDLQDITCQPALNITIPAGASIVCRGSHSILQDELELGKSSPLLAMQADNLALGSIIGARFAKSMSLPAVRLSGVASVQVQLSTQDCQKPLRACKHQDACGAQTVWLC